MADGRLMDERFGCGWRLVSLRELVGTARAGLQLIDLGRTPESEGVVETWMHRHGCCAALVRPDHYVYGAAANETEVDALLNEWQATRA